MNCTPKVRQKKSNFWGVFIMKLTYEDKVQIYELEKPRSKALNELSNKFGINISNLRYMIKLIDRLRNRTSSKRERIVITLLN